MLGNGEAEKEAIRPDFNSSIFIDFAGAKITLDAGMSMWLKIFRWPIITGLLFAGST